MKNDLAKLKPFINVRSFNVFSRAEKLCSKLCAKTRRLISVYCKDNHIDQKTVCFIAIGSVGRQEALEASDLDLIPVLKNSGTTKNFNGHDNKIRKLLSNALRLKVSEGKDLTRYTALDDLTKSEIIGSEQDNSSTMTKRILILSEGIQVGGKLPIEDVRKGILNAYGRKERTSGRHVLSLCNDLARYYRTLCIEYKAKVDNEDKDWCTRNIKLRHSRKFWYFSSILAIVTIANYHPSGEEKYIKGLLNAFVKPPILRFFDSIPIGKEVLASKILESFSWFLEFMAIQKHRKELAKIKHSKRYEAIIENPFPTMKLNSDIIHHEMLNIIDSLDNHIRHKIFDWFLL